jgi:hypothetical protein
MLEEIPTLYIRLSSKSKQVRLETLSLILSHPDAKPVDLVRCLCSEDQRNGEFNSIPGLLNAIYKSWTRLHGVLDPGVYRYLSKLYRSAPDQHLKTVVHILELLGTQKTLDMLKRMRNHHQIYRTRRGGLMTQ